MRGLSAGDFSLEVAGQFPFYAPAVFLRSAAVFSHQDKELGKGTLGGGIAAIDHSGFLKTLAGGIDVHIHRSGRALSDVQQHLAHRMGPDYHIQEPFCRRCVA